MSLPEISWYAVEQGLYSPRDKSIGYRFYGYFSTKKEAEKVAKKLEFSRVLYVKIVSTYQIAWPSVAEE